MRGGVDIADFLVAKYPEEMTIVLQHKFWGLEVLEDHFAVTLSFNKHHERLALRPDCGSNCGRADTPND